MSAFRAATAFLSSAVILGIAISVWLLSADARKEIDALATSNVDNAQWVLAQAEVEAFAFRAAVLGARLDPSAENLNDVRRRFDILYSRAMTIGRSSMFLEQQVFGGVEDALQDVQQIILEAVPIIDADDQVLLDSLPRLDISAEAARARLREIALAGVSTFAELSQARRDRLESALFDLAVTLLVLFLALGAVIIAISLTSRVVRRQAAVVQRTEARLQAIISTSFEAVLAIDEQGKIVEFNGAAQRIFGYSPQEAIGRNLTETIVPERFVAAHKEGMQRYLTTGEHHVVGSGLVHMEARNKAGELFPVEMSISVAEGETGKVFVSFIKDISDQVAAEKELVEARDKALAGERAKANLLAVMSHEMRTPLNGIIGSLDLMERDDLKLGQGKYLDVIQTSARMLLGHVNNVLDIARLDAGKEELSLQGFDPEKLAQNVLESLRPQALVQNNKMKLVVLGDLPPVVLGDKDRLSRVLINLLGNAIKFTQNGLVTLEIEAEPGGSTVEFRVIDTGIGIAEEDLVKIYDDFATLDSSFARKVEGTGLGLGITRRLVALMGGETGVESEVGDGSLFWLRLPLPAVFAQFTLDGTKATGQPAAMNTSGLRVLLVEDNEINRLVAREILARMGCEITEAVDGQEGIDAAMAEGFDLILMDISMPRVDGVSATRAIRSHTGPNRNVPIVAVTAHALPEHLQSFDEAGISDVVIKPITRATLSAAIQKLGLKVGNIAIDDRSATNAKDRLADDLGGALAHDLMRRAIAELRSGLDQLERHIETALPMEDAAALSHKLAGTAAMLGEKKMNAQFLAVERQCEAGTLEPESIAALRGMLERFADLRTV